MREKIENARRQAEQARIRAARCTGDAARAEWLVVSRMWEDLALEYAGVLELQRKLGGGQFAHEPN
jgi:hypothetical protein